MADWVESFTPLLFDLQRPTAWPTQGSLLLDHMPFRIRAEDVSGVGIPGGRVAFDVFSAVGYRAGKSRLWHAEAFPSAHPQNWSAFLAALPGGPERVVCDAHKGMIQAIEQRWPAAELHQCEWHLQHALERLLAKEARKRPGEELAELRDRAVGALAGPSSGGRSCGRLAPSRTRASIAGSPSTARRSRSSSLGGRLLRAGLRRCP